MNFNQTFSILFWLKKAKHGNEIHKGFETSDEIQGNARVHSLKSF